MMRAREQERDPFDVLDEEIGWDRLIASRDAIAALGDLATEDPLSLAAGRHDAQQRRVMALNLVIAAIIYWNTSYMDKAADHLRRQSRLPDPSLLRHVSPLGWDHIVLTGDYDWNSGAAERTNVRALNLYPAKIRA